MKALIMKDACVLWKQMRIFVFLLAVMSVTGGAFNSVFIVVWCSMLPYTAIAYDERSHWNQLAAMMPYSRRDLVLSKYVLGWLCMAVCAAGSMALQAAATLIGRGGPDVSMMLGSLLTGVICLDLTLPMIFRFGVERGRMIFMLIVFAAAVAGGAAADVAEEIGRIPVPVIALLPLAAVVCTAVSISLSMKLYRSE